MMNMAVAFFVCMAFCISVMAFLCSLSDKRKERRWRREDEIAMRRLKRQDEENRIYCEYQKGLIESIEKGNADEYIERHISKEREERFARQMRSFCVCLIVAAVIAAISVAIVHDTEFLKCHAIVSSIAVMLVVWGLRQ